MTLFYIDPQSFYNLAVYDKSLLSNIQGRPSIHYFCSSEYDAGELEGIVSYTIFRYNKKKHLFKIISYCYSLLCILRFSMRLKPDIIHIQWFKIPHVDYLVYKYIRKRTKASLVFTAHNILPHNTGEKYVGIYSKIYNIVDAIIVHDQKTKGELIEKFGLPADKITIIRHGLIKYNVERSAVEKEIDAVKAKYQINEEKLLLCAPGKQSYYKGSDVLLKAWTSSEILTKASNACLLVAGKCGGVDITLASNVDNIYFEDRFLSDERFEALLEMSDVLVLPYRKISQSGVLLSAIFTETPFLVTDIGGLSEPLMYGDVGWRIAECKEELIAGILEDLINNPSQVRLKKQDKAQWAKVKAEYKWEKIGAKTTTLYQSLL